MLQQIAQSVRSLRRRPGVSLFIILILALCIGGNAAIFSAAKAVLFQRLAYNNIDRLVLLSSYYLPNASETDLSWTETIDWGQRSQLLEQVSPFLHWQDRLLILKDSVERIEVNFVTPGFFGLLGARPEIGRIFSAEENGAPGSAPSVIISHRLWERVFAKDPAILGQKIQLNSNVYTVIGVMPKDFYSFLQWRFGDQHDAWLPAVMAGDAFQPGLELFDSRGERNWFGLARLKPGVTLEQVQKEGASIAIHLQREFPDTNKDYVALVSPLRQYMFGELYPGMKMLLAGAVFVLLIGCANIANLLLVRLAERRRDLSLRLSLGSGRWRLIRQVLTESTILALLGGGLGMLLALWGVELLRGLLELLRELLSLARQAVAHAQQGLARRRERTRHDRDPLPALQ